jgi:peptide/nickel transport system permease protein
MLGENAAASDKDSLRKELGLDKPIAVQYLSYLKGVVTFDLGHSISTGKPVASSIADRFPATLELAGGAMFLAIIMALPIGVVSAYYNGKAIDKGAMFVSLAGLSMPSFWIGPLLILFFAIDLHWFPVSGRDGLSSLVLPSITLGSAMSAILSRLTRSTMIDTLSEDYVTTAISKGASRFSVLFYHALKNALLPVVTVAGLQMGALLAGAIITETIFSWPGIGRLTVQAINARDYPLVQGAVLSISLSYVLVNMLVDILYGWIDPRVRLS